VPVAGNFSYICELSSCLDVLLNWRRFSLGRYVLYVSYRTTRCYNDAYIAAEGNQATSRTIDG
jgi:hypothetical protein